MKAAIYCRVSTDEQAENGTSLDTQREQAEAYVKSRGWTLVQVFEDAGISGTKDEAGRAGLRALMESARRGEIEVVVVMKVDRFSRSVAHFTEAVAELKRLGVDFASVTEGFDSTQLTGQLMQNILASFAEFEHGRIKERMMLGRRTVVEQGYWGGGNIPFGYRAVADGSHTRLEVDEEAAETIRLAASLLVNQGYTTTETSDHLNALGRKPGRAERWDAILVRHMMRRKNNVVPTILDESRFAEVQMALDASKINRDRKDEVYPLSLRLYGTCGAQYTGVYRKELSRRYYACKNKAYERREVRCKDRALRADDIEAIVWEQVCDLLSQPQRLLELAEQFLGMRPSQLEVERDGIEETERKLRDNERAIKNVLLTSAKAGLEPRDIEIAVADLTGERDALRRHMAMIESWQMESERESERMRRLWALADAAHKRLPQMTPEEQKEVLDLLDVRVTVLAHATRTTPARVGIEGVVYDALLSEEKAVRELARPSPLRGSSPSRCAGARPRECRARP